MTETTPKKGRKPNVPNMRMPTKQSFWTNVVLTILLFFLLSLVYSGISEVQKLEEIPVSELMQDVAVGNVETISVSGNKLKITYRDETKKRSVKEMNTSLPEMFASYGITAEQLASTSIVVESESGFWYWVLTLAPIILPLGFIIFFIWMLSRQVKGAGMQALNFGQSRARFFDPKDKTKVTFKDVAGVKEAKEELLEIVDFLKNPKKFLKIGAQIPKGVLLMGSPGTGKTLLARAVAGEANVPFFSISGSEFVEMFVGVGASRVRDLFQTVKKAAPAIIFIDEIDAVGRVRGAGLGGGNDEREQTLNQILVEMDGFEPNESVIVMAATNRPDVLDPALLRPGRFDRRVRLDLPDRSEREAILAVHSKEKPLAEDVNLKVIAERTPGFSGADLQSLTNEAAILAARENRLKVSQYDLIRSIEKVMLGPERKSHILSDHEKNITAYHEAGHALVASVLPNADPVHKVSIIARGHAGGYTLSLPLEEKRLLSKKSFVDRLAMILGGYAAEQEIFGDITTGPSSDLQIASALARDMVARYGMSSKIGPVAFHDDGVHATAGGMIVEGKEYSEKIAATIDEEVKSFVEKALEEATEVLKKHRPALDAIVAHLLEKETLEQEEFEAILLSHGIVAKGVDKKV
jgi:cell division protease FtsH